MQVTMTLKNWKVDQDPTTKLPKLKGRYTIMHGEKELASQEFNDGYNSREIPFSNDLVAKLVALEAEIKADMERLLI